MNPSIEVSGELLAELTGRGLGPDAAEWRELLEGVRPATFPGNVAEKMYWVDLYRRRRDSAAARGDTGLAAELGRVVEELGGAEGGHLVLVLVTTAGHGRFIWLDSDLSSMVTVFCAPRR
ncbi:hypothetical protein [Spongiactinospora sp. 9N601]|uniref:hypothetical protein n=1 Tax=Spongiactinospora sp. 9N601 TaxID=3375149 RepID=UPI0037B43C13